jgi:hypothetical protein
VFSCCCWQFKTVWAAHDAVSLNSFAVSNTLNTFTSCKYKKLWIWTYKSPNIGVKNFSPGGPIAGFHKSLNVEHCIFCLKISSKKTSYSVFRATFVLWEQMRTRKTRDIKINMTCASDFRLKKLYLFLHIFLIFSRENSSLGTSPPMLKSVWNHIKVNSIICSTRILKEICLKNRNKHFAIPIASKYYIWPIFQLLK